MSYDKATQPDRAQIFANENYMASEIELEQLGIASRRTLQKKRLIGGGPPFHKLSARCVRYRIGDVRAWLALHRVDTAVRAR
jgi:hypothetical protein